MNTYVRFVPSHTFITVLVFILITGKLASQCGRLYFGEPTYDAIKMVSLPLKVESNVSHGIYLTNFHIRITFSNPEVFLLRVEKNIRSIRNLSYSPLSKEVVLEGTDTILYNPENVIATLVFYLNPGDSTLIEFDAASIVLDTNTCKGEPFGLAPLNFHSPANAMISGGVDNVGSGQNLMGVTMEIFKDGDTSALQTVTTNSTGRYVFSNLPLESDYVISAKSLGDPGCGISTADITLILRHLLKIQPFEAHWQYIAADVNGDGKISALDIVSLKRQILKIADLPKSWAILPQYGYRGYTGYRIEIGTNLVAPYAERKAYPALNTDWVNDNFFAIKIGDVTGNCTN